jgi:DNA-binding transcriptional LysR family regulator
VPDAEPRRPESFRLLVVPGVTVDKWARMWAERQPEVELLLVPADPAEAVAALAGAAGPGRPDAGLVRLPVDPDACHAIPLYTEVTVVVVPRDHLLTAGDEVTLADLAGEPVLRPLDDSLQWGAAGLPGTVSAERPASTAAAVELVAAGVGVLVTPLSLARAYHRRDLTYRVVTDAPTSAVALAWRRDGHTGLVEEMIGIVRGRTANSTRGQPRRAEPTARRPVEGGAGRTAPGRAGERRAGPGPGPSPRRRGR